MTIHPLKIPCAYCGGAGEITAPERMSMEKRISCRRCRIVLRPAAWIEGGINALAGKLMRKDCSIGYAGGMNWRWSFPPGEEEEEGKFGTAPSFEMAVLDAWEILEKEGDCSPP